MTDAELFDKALHTDRVFELICHVTGWRAFCRSNEKNTEGGAGYYKSFVGPTAREAIEAAYVCWATEQMKRRLTK